MYNHVSKLMMNFNFNKFIYLLILNAHKNT